MSKFRVTLDQVKIFNDVFVKVLKRNLKLSLDETSKNLKKAQQEIIMKKVTDVNSWYTRTLGLDEVKKYQERVVTLQEKLLDAQERRRNIAFQLSEIRKESNDMQDQIHKVKRQDDFEKYLNLMRKETEILQREREIGKLFNECDREEREIFTAYTNSVKDSHEKQRAQLEYTKYFGLILSVVGSFLTFCYSTLKKKDLQQFVEKQLLIATGSSRDIVSRLADTETCLNDLKQLIATSVKSKHLESRLMENERQLNELVQYVKSNEEARSNLAVSNETDPEDSDSFYNVIGKNRIILATVALYLVLKVIYS